MFFTYGKQDFSAELELKEDDYKGVMSYIKKEWSNTLTDADQFIIDGFVYVYVEEYDDLLLFNWGENRTFFRYPGNCPLIQGKG